MRAEVIRSCAVLMLLASSSLGCALDPVVIGRFEAGDGPELELDPTSGTMGHGWSQSELYVGVVETVSIDLLEIECSAEVYETLRVVIELLPTDGGALPEDLDARMLDDDQLDVASFEASGDGRRLDAVVEPGWRVTLHADTPVELEIHARVFALP
jgi:hypothetical protein